MNAQAVVVAPMDVQMGDTIICSDGMIVKVTAPPRHRRLRRDVIISFRQGLVVLPVESQVTVVKSATL